VVTGPLKSNKRGSDEQERTPEMAEHKHGSMDITDQQNTFDGFMKFTKNAVILIILFLIFLALTGA
jgi:hypothetical protein